MDPAKVSAVKDWPNPTNRKQLQRFNGFWGLPTDIVSDRGPQFTSQLWKAFCKAIGTTTSLSPEDTIHSPTARWSGPIRRWRLLSAVSTAEPSSWRSRLPEYAHNMLPNASSGMSPFLCSLGYEPPLFPDQEEEIAVPSVQAYMCRCRGTRKCAYSALLDRILCLPLPPV